MPSVTINSKTFFPTVPEIPYIPAIEPCEEYPDGVPAQEHREELPAHWIVDCVTVMELSTHSGCESLPLGEDATDEDLINFLLGLYNLIYTPPEEA